LHLLGFRRSFGRTGVTAMPVRAFVSCSAQDRSVHVSAFRHIHLRVQSTPSPAVLLHAPALTQRCEPPPTHEILQIEPCADDSMAMVPGYIQNAGFLATTPMKTWKGDRSRDRHPNVHGVSVPLLRR